MKIFLSFLLLFTLSHSLEAKTTQAKKKVSTLRYRNVICNQKYIPMKIEQTLDSHLLTVKFTAQRQIDQFIIKNVRGIEGVSVTKYQEQNQSSINRGDVLSSAVELSDFSGLVYVVFDVSITVDGVVTGHSIPVAVGRLSALQKAQRAKNIKEAVTPNQSKKGSDALSAPAPKFHEMKID